MQPKELELFLHEKIPMSRAMGVQVERCDEVIQLRAALLENQNHMGTAFGGSLNTLMILAAYCRLFVMIGGQGHVVLKTSSAEFLKPVKETLVAVSLPPDPKAADEFLKTYRKKNRARILLQSEIRLSDGSVACRLQGEFVGVMA